MSARDAPDYADADGCTLRCVCRECLPEASDADRRERRFAEALACQCLICKDYIRSRVGKH